MAPGGGGGRRRCCCDWGCPAVGGGGGWTICAVAVAIPNKSLRLVLLLLLLALQDAPTATVVFPERDVIVSDVFEASTPRCAFPRNSTSNFSLSISLKKYYLSFSQSPLPKISCSNTRAFGRRLRLLLTRNCPSKIPWHAQERYYKPDQISEIGRVKSHVNSLFRLLFP